MTRARSLLHAAGVFAAVLTAGWGLTLAVAWLARGLADSLTGAALVLAITALGPIVTTGGAVALASTTYDARRKS